MPLNPAMRERFTDSALTASGPTIIGMAYDRIDRDLAGAIGALERRDVATAHEQLVHAQDIVHELLCMLDLGAWEHAAALASIYRYVIDLLVRANVAKAVAPAVEARLHLAEIGDAFRRAAKQLAAPAQAAGAAVSSPFAAAGIGASSRLSVRA